MIDVQALFIDNAKMYAHLSTGAFVLSVAFVRDVLGVPKDRPIPRNDWLISSWIFWGLSILASTLYLSLLAEHLQDGTFLKGFVSVTVPFGIMMASFYLGLFCFAVMAVTKTFVLPREDRRSQNAA